LVRVVVARWGRGRGTIPKELVENNEGYTSPRREEKQRENLQILIFHSPLPGVGH